MWIFGVLIIILGSFVIYNIGRNIAINRIYHKLVNNITPEEDDKICREIFLNWIEDHYPKDWNNKQNLINDEKAFEWFKENWISWDNKYTNGETKRILKRIIK